MEEKLKFKGVVIEHKISKEGNEGKLTVELRDEVYKHTEVRQNKVHKIGKQKEQTLVQHYCTDWDYWICLADLYSKWVKVENGAIYACELKDVSSIKHKEFTETDAVDVITGNEGYTPIPANTNSPISIENISSLTMSSFGNTVGNKDEELKRLVEKNEKNEKGDRYKAISDFVSSTGLNDDIKKKWIEAEETKIKFSDTGSLTFKAPEGMQDIALGQKIKIDGIADKFDKVDRLITSISHNIDASGNNGWETTIGYGMSKEWHIEKHPDVIKPPAAALTPGVHGLQVGEIADKPGDLDGKGEDKSDSSTNNKVRVKLYNNSDFTLTALKPNVAGSGDGTYQMYYAGDIVIINFINGNPDNPVIIGQQSNLKELYKNSKSS